MSAAEYLREIAETAQAIAERAKNIPVGNEDSKSLLWDLKFALFELKSIESDLDNLTEDDYRNESEN
jgi:hypothetical protein